MNDKALAKVPAEILEHPLYGEISSHFGEAQLEMIRRKFASDHTTEEFFFNCNLAKVNGVNPLEKQCVFWIASRNNPQKRSPVLVITIDGYRARAERQDDFLRSYPEVVCEKDAFTWDAKEQRPAEHSYGKSNRGKVLLAYHICERKGRPPSAFVIKAEEFRNVIVDRTDFHAKMPEHMMKKIVQAQGLRANYPEAFSGTFIPEEMGGSTTAAGDIVIPKRELDTIPESETPRTQEDRQAVCEQIEDLFSALEFNSNTERRDKVTAILGRKIAESISLMDMVGPDLIRILRALGHERAEGQVKKAEVVEAEPIEPKTDPLPPESGDRESFRCCDCKKEIPESQAMLFTDEKSAKCAECSRKALEAEGQGKLL